MPKLHLGVSLYNTNSFVFADSSVGAVTRLLAGQPKNCALKIGRRVNDLPVSKNPDGPETLGATDPKAKLALAPGVKRRFVKHNTYYYPVPNIKMRGPVTNL